MTMQSYQPVRRVLESVRDVHEELINIYQAKQAAASDEQLARLFEFLAEREGDMKHTLDRYLKEGPEGALGTWFQYVPARALRQAMAELDAGGVDDAEDVIARAHAVDHALIQLYHQLSTMIEASSLEELFDGLEKQEEAKAEIYQRTLERMRDGAA